MEIPLVFVHRVIVRISPTFPEVETPILWPPEAKSQLPGKDTDAGKDWGHEKGRQGETEGETFGRHRWLDGRELEQTPQGSEGQGAWHAAVHGSQRAGHGLVTTATFVRIAAKKTGVFRKFFHHQFLPFSPFILLYFCHFLPLFLLSTMFKANI